MPVTLLLVEGELDAQLLMPIFAGHLTVEATKSSKNALAPRTRTERQKHGHCVSYLRDRDFDYDPPDQMNQLTVDKVDKATETVLGWRWYRHSIESYMLEPSFVCSALDVAEANYSTALCKAGNRIKYYQAARWAIAAARSALPPFYELRTQPDEANEFYLPHNDELTEGASKSWALNQVQTFADRVLPKLESDAIAQSYDKYARLFCDDGFISVASVLIYFSGKDIMESLAPWWRLLDIRGANDFRTRIRDWMRAHPKDVISALPEWQSLLESLQQ